MALVKSEFRAYFSEYAETPDISPLFCLGEARAILKTLPDEAIDFCMTSPPYWGQRQYQNGGIGLEEAYEDYILNLLNVFAELRRVLKPTGSFWLNLGDTYRDKKLLGIPWRITLRLMDEQGWILRNSVVWNKVKGGLDNAKDRVRNIHENIFFFVRDAGDYYFNVDAIRAKPREARVVNGAVVSATGVTGVRYKRQIELSTALTDAEKEAAFKALDAMLESIRRGETSDFRMIIRNQQRTTHSNSESVSGRARELKEKGFYFLKYHPKGSKPDDVWEILPEDTQNRHLHFAPYPQDLCKLPILASCPPGGIVLDPFCGTGTTMLVAQLLERKSVGIDVAENYLEFAEQRCYDQHYKQERLPL